MKKSIELDCKAGLEGCLDSILDSLEQGVFIANREGRTLLVNRMYEELTGLGRDELLGRCVTELKREGVFNLAPITPTIIKSGKPVTSVQIGRDNRRVIIDGRPVFDADGQVHLVIIFVRDVTLMSAMKEQIAAQSDLIEKFHHQVKYLSKKNSSRTTLASENPEFRKLWELAGRIALSEASVLLLGETGVGKGVFARFLHENSWRKDMPFFKVDCAAIPENLLESELFGYAPGAFSGANPKGKPGFFDLADKGTIFLDEVGELPLTMQAKLLRILQDQELVRLGGTKPVKVDVRVIAATNRNLEELVGKGSFRGDLYYRLCVTELKIPPLREHPEDILPLARHYLDKFGQRQGRKLGLSSEAEEAFLRHNWPGNVRELENLAQNLVVTCESDPAWLADLPVSMRVQEPNCQIDRDSVCELAAGLPLQGRLKELTRAFEREVITRTMRGLGSASLAAKSLGLDRSTLFRKLK